MSNKINNKNQGFTLIELLAAIMILLLILTITLPLLKGRLDAVKEDALKTVIKNIELSTEKYVLEKRSSLNELDDYGYMNISIRKLIEEKYINGDIINPKTKQNINIDTVVLVTLGAKNKLDFLYDIDQNNKTKIVLNGPMNITLKKGEPYQEYGVLAKDKNGIDVSSSVVIEGTVNVNSLGTYELKYKVNDSITLKRYITIKEEGLKTDLEKPKLTSNIPNKYIETTIGVNITMPVVSATDNVDGNITHKIITNNNINISQTGTYYINYNVTDNAGNRADTLKITVVVKP